MKNIRFSAGGNWCNSVNITELCWFAHANEFGPFVLKKKTKKPTSICRLEYSRVVLCSINIFQDAFAGWFITLSLQCIALISKEITALLAYMLNTSIYDNLHPEP